MDVLQWLFGPDGAPDSRTALQTIDRALLIYGAAIVLFRLGGHRVLSRYTATDVVVGILLGSILSRAVNGSAPLVSTMLTGAAIIVVDWTLLLLCSRSQSMSRLLKGEPYDLVIDGRRSPRGWRRGLVASSDLQEVLRLSGRDSHTAIREARLERNGRISILGAEPPSMP
jgi:uncharacterized membrane protein YcaP (DUF421 family)